MNQLDLKLAKLIEDFEHDIAVTVARSVYRTRTLWKWWIEGFWNWDEFQRQHEIAKRDYYAAVLPYRQQAPFPLSEDAPTVDGMLIVPYGGY